MENSFLLPFLLTLFAGLSTGIGSAIAFLAKTTNKKFLSFSLGLSAGVMIYVSFVEMLSDSQEILQGAFGQKLGQLYTILCFFGGMTLVSIIDKLVPSFENPHEIRNVEDMNSTRPQSTRHFMRMGILTALAIAIHNFPEGIATFMGSMDNSTLGIAIAVAIAIHNIPEGIAVSVPIFYATNSKRKAFLLSFATGFAEPAGATIAYFLLSPFLSQNLMAYIFAAVAGIMVFISMDELLPAAREYGEHHISVYGLLSGMAIMAISLVILS